MRPAVLLVALVAAGLAPATASAALPGRDGPIVASAFGATQTKLWSIAPTDGAATVLVDDSPGLTASLSPDHTKVAWFASDSELFVQDLSTGATTQLMTGAQFTSYGTGPPWSPDSTRIAVTDIVALGDSEYDTHLTVVPVDGSTPPIEIRTWTERHPTNQTTVQETGFQPAWTPDGSEIVIVHTRYECLDGPRCPAFNQQGYNLQAVSVVGGAARDLFPLVMKDTQSTTDTWVSVASPDVAGDGSRVVYAADDRNIGQGSLRVVPLAGGSQTTLVPDVGSVYTPAVFSPSGDSVAYIAGDLYSGTRELRIVDADTHASRTVSSGSEAVQNAVRIQWSPGEPIVFVHGFLASRMECTTGSGTDELWPHIGVVDRPRLGALELAADGLADAGDGTCSGPVTPNGIVESVARSDIHGSTLEFIERAAGDQAFAYAWDWRKSPEQAVDGLDDLIEQIRTDTGAEKVTILAHSFGGLVTRWYIDDAVRAAKVSRALIVGTPSWGSPKAIFPLAIGQESPGDFSLDLFVANDAMRSFAQNLAGAYFLYPGAQYGPWLTVHDPGPTVLDEAGVIDYVDNDLLGNGALLQEAYDARADVLEGWETNGVDVRALVGAGTNTVIGMELLPGQGTLAPDAAELHFGNGDGTVPMVSAVQGNPTDPLGEDIPIQFACGVPHVPLASDEALTDAGALGFLEFGINLTADPVGCTNGGFSIEVHDVDLTPVRRRAEVRQRRRAPQSILDAEAAGDVDVIRFPALAYVVTDDSTPVLLRIDDPDASLVIRRLDGTSEGAPQTIAADPDGLVVATTAAGAVTAGPPADDTTAGPDPGGDSGPADPGPSGTGPEPAPPGPPLVPPGPLPPAAAPLDRTAPRVRVAIRRRGRRFVVTVRATDPSGVRAIQFRFGARGAWRRYRKPLRLSRAQLRRVRVRATDRAGNASRPTAARV